MAHARRSFERRLRIALLLFSLLPSLALLGAGAYLVGEAASLSDSARAWERVASRGSALIERTERSRDPPLASTARAYRAELADAVTQARRREFLVRRALVLIPFVAAAAAAILSWFAARAARKMARLLSRPVAELSDWAGRVGRGEPLPERRESGTGAVEFATLRDAFRRMAAELSASRVHELEAERARTWVTMARHVAHELKNPLTPMRFALRTLERAPPRDSAEREAREVLASESERLEDLARAFAQFGRLPEGPTSEIDLRELVEGLLRTHLPPTISHTLHAPAALPRVRGHHDALTRAVANVLLNAGEAVGSTGAVTARLTASDEMIEVCVRDSGPGIADADLARVWEPDFTTKPRGTGLGLALVRQTILAHGGRVAARTHPEGGAEFRLLLPVGTGVVMSCEC